MNVLFNSSRLSELLNNLQMLTGVWVNIFDADGKDIKLFGNAAAFCRHIQASPRGGIAVRTAMPEPSESAPLWAGHISTAAMPD